jgi:excisionase family DNA binding protein
MQNDDVWAFSVRESARLTGLSVKSLRRLILRGQLDVVRVGSRVLVPAESLRRLLGQVGK